MKLHYRPREENKKSAVKALRRLGKIPAILYSSGKPCQQICIDTESFSAVLRTLKQGRLPTTVFTLMGEGGECRAVIKDIQYELTSYRVLHIDFEELVQGHPVTVKVPISCVGVEECVGVKLGGFLRQVIRYVKVECQDSTHIPEEFVLSVKDLGIRHSKRLEDIGMPAGVRPLASMREVVVTVTRRTT